MRHGIRCWLNISINILITIFIEATYCETRQLVYVGISIGSMYTFKPRSFGGNLNQAMTLLTEHAYQYIYLQRKGNLYTVNIYT